MELITLNQDNWLYLKINKDVRAVCKARNDDGRFNRIIDLEKRNFNKVIKECTENF